MVLIFLFNDTATTWIYTYLHTLSLHDALPIYGGEWRDRPGGDRPRPPGFRLGGQPEPRDRGDAGRLRRGRRLAVAERPAELRVGGDLGVDPPRRRRRHQIGRASCRERVCQYV